MNKTSVTALTLVVGALGLVACSQQPAAPAPAPAPAAAPAAPAADAAAAPAPAAADATPNGPQGDGEVLNKKP